MLSLCSRDKPSTGIEVANRFHPRRVLSGSFGRRSSLLKRGSLIRRSRRVRSVMKLSLKYAGGMRFPVPASTRPKEVRIRNSRKRYRRRPRSITSRPAPARSLSRGTENVPASVDRERISDCLPGRIVRLRSPSGGLLSFERCLEGHRSASMAKLPQPELRTAEASGYSRELHLR